MYCPGCGSEDRQASQYCRACGTDLRTVRMSIERPDSVTASAVTAREDVLPQIEKSLESYAEKRRRVLVGVIVAANGFGAVILGLIMSVVRPGPDADSVPIVGLGAIALALGIGLMMNGLLFTRPRQGVADHSADARLQNLLDSGYAPPQSGSSTEAQPTFRSPTTSNFSQAAGSSVTEHTTRHLKTDR